VYESERPHEALGGTTLASRYTPSLRRYPGGSTNDYRLMTMRRPTGKLRLVAMPVDGTDVARSDPLTVVSGSRIEFHIMPGAWKSVASGRGAAAAR
jgi:hypothetical protein